MAPCLPAPLQTVVVGDVQLTYLPDGEAHFAPTQLFPASTPEGWEEHARWLDDDGRLVATVGAFLVRTGDRKIVVDLGLGVADIDIPDFGWARTGTLLDSLAAAGATPAEIDTVVYTHLHSDHAGWTSDADHALTFPNAEHVIGAAVEFEFWRAHPDVAFAPAPDAVLDPLESRLTIAGDGYAVAPGLTLVATPGHTPGHQTIVVSSGSERAVILGDVMHCPVQLVEPEWSVLFDIDPAMAARTRERVLDELTADDVTIGCGHFPEAAFGRVLRGAGKRYWQ